MQPISYKHHRFPADVIRQVVWLYFRFTLSYRDVEDLQAQRGIEVSYETIRCWTLKFGRLFAHNLRRSRAADLAGEHRAENSHLAIRRRERKQQKVRIAGLGPAVPIQPSGSFASAVRSGLSQ